MYSKDLRVAGTRAYMRTRSFRKVADLLGVSKSTLHRWVTCSPAAKRISTARKATVEAVDAILDVLAGSCFKTVKQVAAEVNIRLGVSLSGSCVRFWMKRCGITRKKPSFVVTRPGLDADRAAFAAKHFRNIDPERVVSVDETSFYFDMKPGYGYCHRSHRLACKVSPGGRTRWTLIMAVSNERMVGWKLIRGSANGAVYADFIRNLNTDERDVILMDNASIHKTAAVMDVFEDRDLTPCFLPPYTPSFQPVEHCFFVIKNAYRRTDVVDPPCSDEAMAIRVKETMQHLAPESLDNTFTACWLRAAQLAETMQVESV